MQALTEVLSPQQTQIFSDNIQKTINYGREIISGDLGVKIESTAQKVNNCIIFNDTKHTVTLDSSNVLLINGKTIKTGSTGFIQITGLGVEKTLQINNIGNRVLFLVPSETYKDINLVYALLVSENTDKDLASDDDYRGLKFEISVDRETFQKKWRPKEERTPEYKNKFETESETEVSTWLEEQVRLGNLKKV